MAYTYYQTEAGIVMSCKRNSVRIDIEHDGVLHYNAAKYVCKVKNFSLSGVLISAPGLSISEVEIGALCDISFGKDFHLDTRIFSSRVARLSIADIGLSFTGATF